MSVDDAGACRIERNADPDQVRALLAGDGLSGAVPSGGEQWIAWRGAVAVAGLEAFEARDLVASPATALVGRYVATDRDGGSALLRAAATALTVAGAARVLGPVDGSTWGRYRLALPPEDPAQVPEPPFLGEPTNPSHYVDDFTQSGFAPVAWYESSLLAPLTVADPRAAIAASAVADAGITIAPLALDGFDAALDGLYRLSLDAFARNPFYSPIDSAGFRALYEPVRTLIDPELVLLARDRARTIVGVAFAIPDVLGARAGRPGRVVLKTLAVTPVLRRLGLGALLVDGIRARAHALGFSAVIHALMHVDNASRRISERTAMPMRRYALFAWGGPGGE